MKTTLMLMIIFLGKGEQIKVDVNLFCFVKKTLRQNENIDSMTTFQGKGE